MTAAIPDDAEQSQHRFVSPLRYPGGKAKVTNYFKLLFLRSGLVGHRYLEPYAGGASVGLALLFEEYVERIHINDVNPSVYAFWKTAVEKPDELCRRIREVPLTIEEFHRQREVQADRSVSPAELAFSTLFLNRTSRSGILRGGPIGGYDQTGSWGLDARFPRRPLCERIEKVARFASRITVTGKDALELLREVRDGQTDELFVYLDPPYFNKAADLYTNHYSLRDHQAIAGEVAKLPCPWVVSYDNVQEAHRLYAAYPRWTCTLVYSAGNQDRGQEMIAFGPGVVPLEVERPASVHQTVVDDERLARLRAVW